MMRMSHFTLILFLLVFSVKIYAQTVIRLVEVTNFNPTQRQKLDRIIATLQKVINSEVFKNAVLNNEFNKSKSYANNNGQRNDEIYLSMMSGADGIKKDKDRSWDLHLNLRFIFSRSTVAYTLPGSPMIHLNQKFFINESEAKMAGTLCHEYSHKVGYGHDKKLTAIRPYSVPYRLGDHCESLYKKFDGLNSCGAICTQGSEFINAIIR